MAFKKGEINSEGRPKGSPNKTTKRARELFVQIMNGQTENINEALEKVRAENPAKFLDLLSKLYQYYMPKKIDLTTDDEPLNKVEVKYVDTEDRGE